VKIRRIRLYRIVIPFRKPFTHAASERSATDNIVVETALEDGTLGYGEGLPRSYVTGETPESLIASLRAIDQKVFRVDPKDLQEVVAFLEEEVLNRKNLPEGRLNNTARCALELSLLDAYGRSFQKSFWDVAATALGGDRDLGRRGEVYYDGVLTLASPSRTVWSALRMRGFGFRRVKIKVETGEASILRTVRWVRRILGPKIDLRIDANGGWTPETAVQMVRELQAYAVSAIEQPLSHAQLRRMRELKAVSPIPLMLDESLCDLEDAKKAIDEGLCDLFNIRLSKCGGFLNSLRMAALARRSGLGYQLGCLVGETGILSAAGRQFACLDPNLRYLEGSYDRYLLRDNVVYRDISFGRRGRAPALGGFGLGIEVDRDKLRRYAVFQAALFG
jgi:muconate cycloisomerase